MSSMTACLFALGTIAALTSVAASTASAPLPLPPVERNAAQHRTIEPAPWPRPHRTLLEAEALVISCEQAALERGVVQGALVAFAQDCDDLPNGYTTFSATLLPDGSIHLGHGSDRMADGLVPTCALAQGLRHASSLTRACALRVTLRDETAVQGILRAAR